MESRKNPYEELKEKITLIERLIDEVIHLDAMNNAFLSARESLMNEQLKQQEFYKNSKISPTPQNIQFLNETIDGEGFQLNINLLKANVNALNNNIHKLYDDKFLRMKPLQDLWEHVTSERQNLNQKYVTTLLNNMKILNPEGSIHDVINMIGEIIRDIVTLRFYEIEGTIKAQQKKNSLRNRINNLFNRNFAEDRVEYQSL
jgi:hypothetical protein